jgi:hypothetical protein
MTTKRYARRLVGGKPPADVAEQLQQWADDVRNERTEEVLLTNLVTYLFDPAGKKGALEATVIRGYWVLDIKFKNNHLKANPCLVYSPLLKTFFGCPASFRSSSSCQDVVIPAVTCYHIPNAIEPSSAPLPLSDDMSKRIWYADKLSEGSSWGFSGLLHLGVSSAWGVDYLQYRTDTKIDDPIPLMARFLNSRPEETRQAVWSFYDRFGAPESLLGDALRHCDSFRSD